MFALSIKGAMTSLPDSAQNNAQVRILIILLSTRHSKTLTTEYKQLCECCAGESSEIQGDQKPQTLDSRRGNLYRRRDTVNELLVMQSSTDYVILSTQAFLILCTLHAHARKRFQRQ
jgi:hypothetical protein